MKNQGNAKAEYSKKLIADALTSCLSNSTFEELTISEICGHAQVSRKTFYRNFTNKREVLEYQNKKIIQNYLAGLKNAELINLSHVIMQIFTVAEKHHNQIKLLVDNHLLHLITEPLQVEIISLYHDRKRDIMELYGEEFVERLLIFSFGGFESYLKQWIYLDSRPSPFEVEKEFRQFLAITQTQI